MTAELIQFERHRDFRRGELYRQQPVPREPSRGAKLCSPIELQVARISRLVTELEELTRTSDDVSVAMLSQARAGLENARALGVGLHARIGLERERHRNGGKSVDFDDAAFLDRLVAVDVAVLELATLVNARFKRAFTRHMD
jgi:hypothetical protein